MEATTRNETYNDLEKKVVLKDATHKEHPMAYLERVSFFEDLTGDEIVTIEQAIRATKLAELRIYKAIFYELAHEASHAKSFAQKEIDKLEADLA